MTHPSSIRLESGVIAALHPDPFISGALTLSLDGTVQSHVCLRQPRELFYDYMRRMGNAIDLVAPANRPITIVHLGAGALTLARYVGITRPGSRQAVVEREAGLVEFVVAAAPLPPGTLLEPTVADALSGVRGLAAGGWAGRADVIVCDVYSGGAIPEHLVTREFYAGVAELRAAGGVILVNVADDAGLAQTRSQASAMNEALPVVAALGPSGVLAGLGAGNVVVLGGAEGLLDRMPRLVAAGPHPAAWQTLAELLT